MWALNVLVHFPLIDMIFCWLLPILIHHTLSVECLLYDPRGVLEESTYMYQLLGLNLLSLLAQNRLAEFHTVSEGQERHVYITYKLSAPQHNTK